MLRHLARAIVNRYPAAWRERYADEVIALIDAGPVRLGDVCGLLRHCITERVLALYEPGRHISAYRFISGMALLTYIAVLFLALGAVGAVPFALGYLIQLTASPTVPTWLYLPAVLLVVVPGVWLHRLKWLHLKSATPLPEWARRLQWVVVGGYALFSLLAGMEAGPELSFHAMQFPIIHIWMIAQVLLPDDLEGVHWPGQGLFETLGRLRSVRYDLRWARMELDRCEGLYAGRDPGPELRAARVEMERLLAAEQTALSELDAMGYQARFQS